MQHYSSKHITLKKTRYTNICTSHIHTHTHTYKDKAPTPEFQFAKRHLKAKPHRTTRNSITPTLQLVDPARNYNCQKSPKTPSRRITSIR